MEKFFNPESIAVIGVSVTRMNLGRIILLNNIQRGYAGKLYGVGAEEGEIDGVAVYTSIAALPETPDVAIIITPAATIPGVMNECGEKGITHVVIESGGFSEYSTGASALEKEVSDIAQKFGIKIIGPNCIGTINFKKNVMMPFVFYGNKFQSGGYSVISQSGGVGNTFLQALPDSHVFLNKFVAVGNKLQLDEVDFLDYFLRDDTTTDILMYLEGFNRGREFFNCAMKAEKPIIVQKSNRCDLSAKIAQSHTTALSSGDDVVDAAFLQSGVIRVEDEDELIRAAKIMQLPLMKGRRVAVLSRSGGHAVISTDACAKFGFELVQFPDSYIEKVKSIYKTRVIAHQNPLDLGEIFDYTIFIKILHEALQLPDVDGVLFNHLYQSEYEAEMSREFLNSVNGMVAEFGKPVSIAMISDASEILDVNKNHPYPIFTSPLQAAHALAISAEYYERIQARNGRGSVMDLPIKKDVINGILRACNAEGRIPLTDEALAICRAAGIDTVHGVKVNSADDVSGITMSYPAVVKLLSRDASHKSDVGGVKLNLMNRGAVAAGIRDICASLQRQSRPITVDGFFVHEMAPDGVEFFVGARRDPSFGPIVMAGLGGIFIEIFKDRAIRIAPVTEQEAFDMLKSLISYPILRGARGRGPLDEEALIKIICGISNLITAVPDITEIDLNPVIVYPRGQGVAVVDSRVFYQTASRVPVISG